MAGAPNCANRTMWTRDNLDVLHGLNSESIELVYADPPFNSNRNYEAPIGWKAAGAGFKDTQFVTFTGAAKNAYNHHRLHGATRTARTPGRSGDTLVHPQSRGEERLP